MKEQCPSVDTDFAKCGIMANKKNSLTAHYHLLVKKKTILGESMSDFSQLDLLDDDADMQVQRTKNHDQALIPFVKQVRAHHSIPAAPRHNIGNLDKIRD